MKPHSPYRATDWTSDKARANPVETTSCPDCGSDEHYGPRGGIHSDGSPRNYRACKMCGFWQEADGSDPYRCWQSSHECRRELDAGGSFICEYCGQTFTTGDAPVLIAHTCGKYLKPDEDGYECGACGKFQGRDTLEPWPLEGSG